MLVILKKRHVNFSSLPCRIRRPGTFIKQLYLVIHLHQLDVSFFQIHGFLYHLEMLLSVRIILLIFSSSCTTFRTLELRWSVERALCFQFPLFINAQCSLLMHLRGVLFDPSRELWHLSQDDLCLKILNCFPASSMNAILIFDYIIRSLFSKCRLVSLHSALFWGLVRSSSRSCDILFREGHDRKPNADCVSLLSLQGSFSWRLCRNAYSIGRIPSRRPHLHLQRAP